jgi:hypothetical protein
MSWAFPLVNFLLLTVLFSVPWTSFYRRVWGEYFWGSFIRGGTCLCTALGRRSVGSYEGNHPVKFLRSWASGGRGTIAPGLSRSRGQREQPACRCSQILTPGLRRTACTHGGGRTSARRWWQNGHNGGDRTVAMRLRWAPSEHARGRRRWWLRWVRAESMRRRAELGVSSVVAEMSTIGGLARASAAVSQMGACRVDEEMG